MTKELSIKNIKKELMEAFLGDMRIISSFSNKDVKKTRDYVGKNILDYLDDAPNPIHTEAYINFDVEQQRGYNVYIVVRMHRDLINQNDENKLDELSNVIKEIVDELYPDKRGYTNAPKACSNNYVERHIMFKLGD